MATGTGSGKTECFLYPILDYWARHRGQPGIKAILIYPMNALATDQAARLARAIHDHSSLRSYVTAGVFIGQSDARPSTGMEADRLITHQNTLRKHPPDILLTNYKMLDFLLMRPGDQGLWSGNEARTLRFLVVDELHSFDGAQGTDLACLIRRLKARLATPPDWLCGIGTSATLGGNDDPQALTAFATQVFGERFEPDAVVGESRVSVGDFLGDHLVRDYAIPRTADPASLDPSQFADSTGYLARQSELWLGDVEAPLDGEEARQALGLRLLGHAAVHNLIKLLGRGPVTFDELVDAASRLFGVEDAIHARRLIVSLLALVAHARRENGPLFDLKLQLWLREWRRMVASLEETPELAFYDDLAGERERGFLPVINCRQCGATGWLAVWRDGDPKLDTDPQTIYRAFFGYDPVARALFPESARSERLERRGRFRYIGRDASITLHAPAEVASLQVWIPEPKRDGHGRIRFDRDCPYCRASHGLTILGARSASLSAVLVSQLAASPHAADKRLIAFSDSVQDAAHRAGFLTARTWRAHFRTALTQCLDHASQNMPLSELPDWCLRYWRERLGGEAYLIGEFLPPDLHWLRDYERLISDGKLPESSSLPQWLAERIAWECAAEFGLRARIGRTLETSGLYCAAPQVSRLEAAAHALAAHLSENLPQVERISVEETRRFLAGWCYRLRHQGAVLTPALRELIAVGGGVWWFDKRARALPRIGRTAPAPRFITVEARGDFDRLPPDGADWLDEWLAKTLAAERPLLTADSGNVYRYAVQAAHGAGLVAEHRCQGASVWGLAPEALRINGEVCHLRCRACHDRVTVTSEELEIWQNLPCQRPECMGCYSRETRSNGGDYYARLYRQGELHRTNAREHTGLLKREAREALETQFKDGGPEPWRVNLLSATPTLEMGIDIGALSTVLLCAIPPAQPGYLQRIGRAGRRDGNALALAIAEGAAHDLYFYADPKEMIAGPVRPPGIFLDASAVLERQFTAFCLDRWTASGIAPSAFPASLGPVLKRIEAKRKDGFPFDWLEFIATRRSSLLEAFFGLFPAMSDTVRERVQTFAAGGSHDEVSLEWRLVDALTRLAKERQSLREQAKALAERIKRGDADPAQDLDWAERRRELDQERGAYLRIAKDLDARQALNFLTDEGVLPNYAFPESGITLRSVIIRRRGTTEGEGGRPYDISTYDYVRPAAAGLRELAPRASFYAEGRRVAVDQVNLEVSEIESWRLCPECHYAEHERGGTTRASCPRCGAAGFQDSGQAKPMVRLRQVHATTRDRDSRISDDSDQREPSLFEHGLSVDVAPENIEAAWRIDNPAHPFGFELVHSAVLREVNFGPLGAGEPMPVAGKTRPRAGFRVCRHCGKVQKDHARAEHTKVCRASERANADDILATCFLYRELKSEAIRILLPATTAALDARVAHSFVAALLFALKRHFGGRVDHLHATLTEEPVPGTGAARQYVVLYDAIPGGSGYLPELLRSPAPFVDLLATAAEALEHCECAADPARDGCYRCLFAYRLRYELAQVSRRTALDTLKKILASRDKLEAVDSLRSVSVNALFDSELEARFIEALKQADRPERPVRLAPEIVGGKAGYVLTVAKHRYTVEPQAELGSADGVSVASKPDFLIQPTQSAPERLPVAVFTDGLEHHRERVRNDLTKREALRAGGGFLVWTLGWKDVEKGAKGERGYYEDLFRISSERIANAAQAYPAVGADVPAPDWPGNSFELLLDYLAAPDVARLGGQIVGRTLGALDWKGVVSLPAGEWSDFMNNDGVRSGTVAASNGALTLAAAMPRGEAARQWRNLRALVRLIADPASETFERCWLGFWHAFNLLQSLPAAGFGAGEQLPPLPEPQGKAEVDERWSADWRAVLEVVDPALEPLLRAAAKVGINPPEPGFEWQDELGAVAGEAELAWHRKGSWSPPTNPGLTGGNASPAKSPSSRS